MTGRMEERSRRVADAVYSGRLEGFEPSEEFMADAAAYVDGEIDEEELLARGRRRWGLQ